MAGVFGSASMSAEDAAHEYLGLVSVPTEELGELFSTLHVGSGLAALLLKTPAVARVVGAVCNLSALAGAAAANRPACAKLNSLGCELLVLLDQAGRRGRQVDGGVLEALAACADDMAALVEGFCRPGWLLRVLCDTASSDKFTTLHEAALETAKSDAGLMAGQPAGRARLPAADYRDTTKPLRRLVRALGKGNITAGVFSLADNEASLGQVARLLDVSPQALLAEVQQVPASELDVDTLFSRLLGGAEDLSPLLLESAATNSLNRDIIGSAAAAGAAGSAGQKGAGGRRGKGKPPQEEEEAAVGAGGGLYSDLFAFYDKNKSGAIEEEELQAALADLGLLEHKTPAEAAAVTASHLRMGEAAAAAASAQGGAQGCADPAQAGGAAGLGLEAFSRLYDTLVMSSACATLRFKLGLQAEEDLRGVFEAFAAFGSREVAGEMDGAHFQKLCRDCGLISRAVTTTVADLTFAKVKAPGSRRISFDQFVTALAALATKQGVAFEAVVSKVLDAGGPVARATKADAVRLHDDKSAYTGVHARGGGPCSGATTPQFSLAAFLDRSAGEPASATPKSGSRGVGGHTPLRSSMSGRLLLTPTSIGSSISASTSAAAARRSSVGTAGTGGPRRRSSAGAAGDLPSTPPLFSGGSMKGRAGSLAGPVSLKQVFKAFAGFGQGNTKLAASSGSPKFDTFTASPASVAAGQAAGELDGFRFAKLCRQAGLIDASFPTTAADLVFVRVKAKGAKKISFGEFRQALQLIAEEKGVSYEQLAAAVEGCGGPGLHAAATTPDAVRFHDNVRGSIAAS